MEFVILGFLMIRHLSQYAIRNALQRKVSPFFSASLGSIQAALKKLESNGHIEIHEAMESGRRKKLYRINEQGKRHFMDWMLSSITPNRFEQDATTRLFFLGFMAPAERLAIANAIADYLEATVREYEAASLAAGPIDVPDQLRDVVKYQLKTLDLGLYYHRSMLAWFRNLIAEMEDDPS